MEIQPINCETEPGPSQNSSQHSIDPDFLKKLTEFKSDLTILTNAMPLYDPGVSTTDLVKRLQKLGNNYNAKYLFTWKCGQIPRRKSFTESQIQTQIEEWYGQIMTNIQLLSDVTNVESYRLIQLRSNLQKNSFLFRQPPVGVMNGDDTTDEPEEQEEEETTQKGKGKTVQKQQQNGSPEGSSSSKSPLQYRPLSEQLKDTMMQPVGVIKQSGLFHSSITSLDPSILQQGKVPPIQVYMINEQQMAQLKRNKFESFDRTPLKNIRSHDKNKKQIVDLTGTEFINFQIHRDVRNLCNSGPAKLTYLYALLYTTKVTINGSETEIWWMTPPFILPTSSGQVCEASVNIFWVHYFSEDSKRESELFKIPRDVSWPDFCDALNQYFKAETKTEWNLTPDNLEFIRSRLIQSQPSFKETGRVSRVEFCSRPKKEKKDSTEWAWRWIFEIIRLIKSQEILRDAWGRGAIIGFIDGTEADNLVSSKYERGTFGLRFSTHTPGGISVFAKNELTGPSFRPFTIKDFKYQPQALDRVIISSHRYGERDRRHLLHYDPVKREYITTPRNKMWTAQQHPTTSKPLCSPDKHKYANFEIVFLLEKLSISGSEKLPNKALPAGTEKRMEEDVSSQNRIEIPAVPVPSTSATIEGTSPKESNSNRNGISTWIRPIGAKKPGASARKLLFRFRRAWSKAKSSEVESPSRNVPEIIDISQSPSVGLEVTREGMERNDDNMDCELGSQPVEQPLGQKTQHSNDISSAPDRNEMEHDADTDYQLLSSPIMSPGLLNFLEQENAGDGDVL